MKIKKVDDKPVLIHTKKKTQIYAHEPKNAVIKGSNIYTLNRSSKIKERRQFVTDNIHVVTLVLT